MNVLIQMTRWYIWVINYIQYVCVFSTALDNYLFIELLIDWLIFLKNWKKNRVSVFMLSIMELLVFFQFCLNDYILSLSILGCNSQRTIAIWSYTLYHIIRKQKHNNFLFPEAHSWIIHSFIHSSFCIIIPWDKDK